MKLVSFFVATTVTVFSTSAALAAGSTELESSVLVKGFLWNEPGYSWYDCRAGQPGFKATSPSGKEALERYKEPGVKKACETGKGDFIDSGETVDIVLEKNKPVAKKIKTKVGSETKERTFYKVKNPETGNIGWISTDYIRAPRTKHFEAPRVPLASEKPEQECEGLCALQANAPDNSKQKIEALRKDAAELVKATSKLDPGKTKSEKELDRFACFYRNGAIKVSALNDLLPKVKKAANAAEKAFGIPAPVIRCTMLIESGLNGNLKNSIGAAGYGQVLKGTVDMLEDISKNPSFSQKLETYNSLMKTKADISNSSVRMHSNIPSSVAAMALYFNYVKEDYIDKFCRNCSTSDGTISRKEVFLMVTGYNGGHGKIKKVAHKSTAEFFSSGHEETRAYIRKMDRCLLGGYETAFNESPDQIAKRNRERKADLAKLIQNRKQRSQKKGPSNPDVEAKSEERKNYLESLISMNASREYEFRAQECNQAFPL